MTFQETLAHRFCQQLDSIWNRPAGYFKSIFANIQAKKLKVVFPSPGQRQAGCRAAADVALHDFNRRLLPADATYLQTSIDPAMSVKDALAYMYHYCINHSVTIPTPTPHLHAIAGPSIEELARELASGRGDETVFGAFAEDRWVPDAEATSFDAVEAEFAESLAAGAEPDESRLTLRQRLAHAELLVLRRQRTS